MLPFISTIVPFVFVVFLLDLIILRVFFSNTYGQLPVYNKDHVADDNILYPGHPISDEIEKHIRKSAVIIAVVSTEYSKIYYCNTELKEAETTGKPIILIFKEHVDVAAMGITLRTIFMNKVRAKIVLENGEYKMIPEWERLCKDIIGLIEPKN